MTLKATEVKKLLALAHKYRLKSLKVGEFEAHFSEVRQHKLRSQESEPLISSNEKIGLDEGMPTEDELLYWSTNYDPKIHAEKPE